MTGTASAIAPADAMAALAAADRFGEYVGYEGPDGWVFAADPIGSIELTPANCVSNGRAGPPSNRGRAARPR